LQLAEQPPPEHESEQSLMPSHCMSQAPPGQLKSQLVTPSQRKWQPAPVQAKLQLPTPSQLQVSPGRQVSVRSPSRASTTHPAEKK
jgi:hypothetical protein